MNNEKIGRNELLRRMRLQPVSVNSNRLRDVLNGRNYPRKDYIDRLLAATGMTYEKMFATELWEADDGKL